jgi:hypothetical protein
MPHSKRSDHSAPGGNDPATEHRGEGLLRGAKIDICPIQVSPACARCENRGIPHFSPRNWRSPSAVLVTAQAHEKRYRKVLYGGEHPSAVSAAALLKAGWASIERCPSK